MLILYAANTYHYITLCVHLYKNIKEKILCHILFYRSLKSALFADFSHRSVFWRTRPDLLSLLLCCDYTTGDTPLLDYVPPIFVGL